MICRIKFNRKLTPMKTLPLGGTLLPSQISDISAWMCQEDLLMSEKTKSFLFSYLGLVIRKRNWEEVARVRKQIKIMLVKESMGFIVRSRYKENLESEKANLFYLNR